MVREPAKPPRSYWRIFAAPGLTEQPKPRFEQHLEQFLDSANQAAPQLASAANADCAAGSNACLACKAPCPTNGTEDWDACAQSAARAEPLGAATVGNLAWPEHGNTRCGPRNPPPTIQPLVPIGPVGRAKGSAGTNQQAREQIFLQFGSTGHGVKALSSAIPDQRPYQQGRLSQLLPRLP